MASLLPRQGRVSSSAPIKLEIVDVEKVKGLSNYYAYIIKVLCKDGTSYHIYRRYSQFDHMQSALEKRFLIEAGSISAKDRVLPHLPAKKFFGRSAIREVTDKRLPMLNVYLVGLFSLPDNIRYDSIVSSFTRPTHDDLARPYTATHAYKPRSNGAAKPVRPPVPKPARPAQHVIPQGRPSKPLTSPPTFDKVPPNHPLPPRPSNIPTTRGKALYDYTAVHSDELSFQEGSVLSLLEQVDNGLWWRASLGGETGLVPGNYVEVVRSVMVRSVMVQDHRDHVQESDEWDSSDEEGGSDGTSSSSSSSTVVFYYNQAARNVQVNTGVFNTPTFIILYRAIQKQLRRHDIRLNYKDSDGDLVQITTQADMELLTTDATPPSTRQHSKTKHAPWAIYVTLADDKSVYNTAPR